MVDAAASGIQLLSEDVLLPYYYFMHEATINAAAVYSTADQASSTHIKNNVF